MKAEKAHVESQSTIHLLPIEAIGSIAVSKSSVWSDEQWIIEMVLPTGRTKIKRISWSIATGDGLYLTDQKHRRMLDWLKRVAWTLMHAPGDSRKALKITTVTSFIIGLKNLVPWMVENAIRYPSDLTNEVLDEFLDELPLRLAGIQEGDHEASDKDIPLARAEVVISAVFDIWRQRKRLQEAGIQTMLERPWPHAKGARTLAIQVSGKEMGWIPPLPDEIAVPLINQASRFLYGPADDVINLHREVRSVVEHYSLLLGNKPIKSSNAAKRVRRDVVRSFVFSEHDGVPWRGSLEEETDRNGMRTPLRGLRSLIHQVMAACCLVIQFFTGMRVSELCSLKGGYDKATGLPRGVVRRISPSGLNEEFVVTAQLIKGKDQPEEEQWLLASRRIGDTEEPITIRALIVLNELLDTYRKMLGTDSLLVYLTAQAGLPANSSGVSEVDGTHILKIYKRYGLEGVNLDLLPDTSRFALTPNDLVIWKTMGGENLTTARIRKTFASYVLSVNEALLPAVKRQFKHMNMAITEGNYWGSNTVQIEPLESVSRQMTAMMLYQLTQADPVALGRMGRSVVRNIDELRKVVGDAGALGGWAKIAAWANSNGLRATHSEHGTCIPIGASRMDCWNRAGGRPIGVLHPNPVTRDASVCGGCSSFLVDRRHIAFWRNRYVEHRRSLKEAAARGMDAGFRVIQRRAYQAEQVLRGLGVDIVDLEMRINASTERFGK